ncbi:hypothetical protein T4D_12555 [Trichinella pseudospiralis]|uniref:Uncharacterized protein n=1 Tax=Trichinella pseudospiralis TaxID=6337 RepID=A0A0V1FFM5_TRIPS|nr:hypothetical protein T4D_12555 [Trichinella pseudospiralis]
MASQIHRKAANIKLSQTQPGHLNSFLLHFPPFSIHMTKASTIRLALRINTHFFTAYVNPKEAS